MAEIRSTMDIIMEKTRGLTMSEEEKKEFRLKRLTGKIKGLVQRFIDGTISISDLRADIESEREKEASQVDKLLLKELKGRIDPEADNEKVFSLMATLLNLDISPLERRIKKFNEKVTEEKDLRREVLRKKLEERDITGSAVIPNMAIDPTWVTFYQEIKEGCKTELGAILDSQTTVSRLS